MARIRIVCSACGGDDVRRDATAAWCVETQDWELCSVQDQGYCEDCGGEASLDEEEIEGEAPAVMPQPIVAAASMIQDQHDLLRALCDPAAGETAFREALDKGRAMLARLDGPE